MTHAKPWIFGYIILILITIAAIKMMGWVRENPQHFRSQPFALAHKVGWATSGKLADLSADDAACFAALDAADIAYDRRPSVGSDTCVASQRMVLAAEADFPALSPAGAAPSCAVTAGLLLWQRDHVEPQAEALLGQTVARIENLGSYNCRTVRGGSNPSQHSTANALDISAFILADGSRISVLNDWADEGPKGQFLRNIRDGACDIFTTTLSPDYNAAHADHLHFDLARRSSNWTMCS